MVREEGGRGLSIMSNNSACYNFNSANSANLIFPQGDLYVDTNGWMDIALNRQYGQANENYLTSFIAQQGDPFIVISPHTNDELLQCLNVDQYVKVAVSRGLQPVQWKQIEKTMPTPDAKLLNQRVLNELDKVLANFECSLYDIGNSLNVQSTVKEIMTLYGVPYKDAKHLAYMWHEEVNNLLTNDLRFTLVPGLNIYSAHIRANGRAPFPIENFMPDLPQSLKKK